MSQKKRKKRHSQAVYDAKNRQRQEQLANDRARYGKRLDPAARNLLLVNLVFLAVVSLMTNQGMLTPLVSGTCTIIGIILLLAALWLQFGKKRTDGRNSNWPGLK